MSGRLFFYRTYLYIQHDAMTSSITLTPGTLTVNIDDESNDLFIHMINVPEGFEARESIEAKEVFGLFDCPAWIRRIAE